MGHRNMGTTNSGGNNWYDRNETLQTINRRRSIRQFADRPLTDHDIKLVLQAANMAPSAHNQQSWRFLVVRNERKMELGRLVTARATTFPRPAAALLRMAARSIFTAPAVIGVTNTGDLIEHGTNLFKLDRRLAEDFFRTMEIQSSAAAVQNLLLAATSIGLGTVWLGILYLIKDEVLEFLGERRGEFMAVVPIGYPARPGKSPRKRPLEMLVRDIG
jgi:nitroreductase